MIDGFVCCSLAPIHADAPEFIEMSVEQEILETGIKVVDMLAPYAKGGKIGKHTVSAESLKPLKDVRSYFSLSSGMYGRVSAPIFRCLAV